MKGDNFKKEIELKVQNNIMINKILPTEYLKSSVKTKNALKKIKLVSDYSLL